MTTRKTKETRPVTAVPVPLILERLRRQYPDAHCELNYQTPIQLLVATILSAQCTDERVNQVTPVLFARYPDAADYAAANRADLEALIRPTGFYRQKARYIQQAAHIIIYQHGGKVPSNMSALVQLPGVARKTANVVLGEIYHIAEGITVDTHVKRLAARLGLTTAVDPTKVEQDLMVVVPRESWIEISHLLVFHGRRLCYARRPNCPACPLNDVCPSVEIALEGS